MTITITKVTKWETSDGKIHSSKEMADQHVMNDEIVKSIDAAIYIEAGCDAQDFVNWMASNARMVREFLDACDAMEKASLR
jgi:hypothetical protein